MALLSSFLDKHYPHEEMVKQRKKHKGISASSSSDLLPLKSILEVLLNKSMRPDPYVSVDEQVCVHDVSAQRARAFLTVRRSGGTATWSCWSERVLQRRTATTAAGERGAAARRLVLAHCRRRIRLVDFLK